MVSKNELRIEKLQNINQQGNSFDSMVKKFCEAIVSIETKKGQKHRDSQCLKQIKHTALELYKILWEPVQDFVEHANLIYIVPHGALFRLPFYALHNGNDWCVKRFPPIAMIPSASILHRINRYELFDKPFFLGMANPNRYLSLKPHFNMIPNTLNEIWESSKKYSKATVLPLLDQLAEFPNKNHFLSLAPKADVIHIACHGIVDNVNPLNSGFFLHKSIDLADKVSAFDLLNCPQLKARLFIASICHGNSGITAGGNEWLGFLRSLLASGVQNVVGAGWDITDNAVSWAMPRFHEELQQKTIARALRDVCAKMSDTIEFSDPYFWSSLAVWGDGEHIKK